MLVLTLLASIANAGPPVAPTDIPETPVVPVAEEVPTEAPAERPAEVPAAPAFTTSEDLSVSGTSNDAFGMGGRVELAGPVGDNAFVMGGEVVIRETVHGDLFVMGGSVELDGIVDGDVYALGGEIDITPNAQIGGHLTAGGGQIDLDGTVSGSASVGAGQVSVGGTVRGDVTVDAGELVIGETAAIAGNLDYTAPAATDGADDAVSGAVTWTQGEAGTWGEEDEPASPLTSMLLWTLWTLWSYLSKLVTGAVLLALFGAAAGRVSRTIVEKPAESLGYGVAGFLFLPMASILAMVLFIPLPLGLLGLASFVVLTYVCQLFAAQALGDLILRRYRSDAWGAPLLSLAIGLVPLAIFTGLPWVGTLFWFVATVMGGGALWQRMRTKTPAATA